MSNESQTPRDSASSVRFGFGEKKQNKEIKEKRARPRPSSSRLNGINGFLLSPYIFIPRANRRVFESSEKVEVYVSWHSIALLSGAINVSATSDCYRFQRAWAKCYQIKANSLCAKLLLYTWPMCLLLIYFHLSLSSQSSQISLAKDYLYYDIFMGIKYLFAYLGLKQILYR